MLGEPEVFQTAHTPTMMGELSFVNMIYWIATTITTVGYGDFSPTTNVSQIFVAFVIIIGVIFFTTASGKLLDIQYEVFRAI